MKILLINTNPVVSRLVGLCVRDETIEFNETATVMLGDEAVYDIVFVDDGVYDDAVSSFVGHLPKSTRVVYLSGKSEEKIQVERFDKIVLKPFLPSQIQHVIDEMVQTDSSVDSNSAQEEKEEHAFIFPLSSPQKDEDYQDTSIQEERVLDTGEVKKIKALLEETDEHVPTEAIPDTDGYEAKKIEVITQKLEEEGLEIVHEEEIADVLSHEAGKKKGKKKKHKNKKSKKRESVYTFEEALLAAVENMKPKKIKKLLKDAEVTISIRFKDKK